MQNKALIPISLLLLFIAFFHAPVQSSEGSVNGQVHRDLSQNTFKVDTSTKAVSLRKLLNLEKLIPHLSHHQVVFVGEQHPRFDHHLNQLAIIRGLYPMHPDLVVGVEFFQQPFQQYLDQYIAGELSTAELLDKTEYYDRWRYDFRLYAPILEFARDNRIPIVALNVPTELIQKVGRDGLKGLSKEERAQIPADIDYSNIEYSERLKKVFEDHPQYFGNFETFYEAQLVWDETMAENAVNYLRDHLGAHMVILAGNGHLVYGAGIPDRFNRRLGTVSTAIVLNDWEGLIEPEIADYLLLSKEKELPSAGFLGIILKQSDGKLKISDFSKTSAAKIAGMKEEDEILSLDGHLVSDMADVKEIMWDKKPGEKIIVKVHRSALINKDEELKFKVELR
jgi:uncharacterized iron-regulated protein